MAVVNVRPEGGTPPQVCCDVVFVDTAKGLHMRLAMSLALAALVTIIACSAGAEDRSLSLKIESGPECSYDGPNEVRAGNIHIVFDNPSKVPTFIYLVRLDDGRSVEEFINHIETVSRGGLPELPEWAELLWNSEAVGPETTVAEEIDVREGVYAMACGPLSAGRAWFAADLTVEG